MLVKLKLVSSIKFNLYKFAYSRVATQKQCQFGMNFQYFDRFSLTFTFLSSTRFEFAFPVKHAFEYAYFDKYAF